MAYNIESLITILKQILNPEQTRWLLDQNKPQLESLLEKSALLKQILEKSTLVKTDSLDIQIRDAAHEAQDIIESHMVDQMLSGPGGATSFTFSTPDLQQVTRALDSATDQVLELVQEEKKTSSTAISTLGLQQVTQPLDSAGDQVVALVQGDKTSSSGAASSSNDGQNSKSVVAVIVGVDEDLMSLKDRLTGVESKLEVVPIVGMGGIGKTTLARTLFEDPLIVDRFGRDRAWTIISQDYNLRAIVLSLLHCFIGEPSNEIIKLSDPELKFELYQLLLTKRYLIVLDDIWSNKFWDDIRRCFPENDNGSRVILTTRESGVANYASSDGQQHQVQLLSNLQSCNLLGKILFGKENCPHEYQKIVKKIAIGCGGLPLAINVVGGLLLKARKSVQAWEAIGSDLEGEMAESGDQRFYNIFLKVTTTCLII